MLRFAQSGSSGGGGGGVADPNHRARSGSSSAADSRQPRLIDSPLTLGSVEPVVLV